mgnify:CR=1 FL=1
MPEKGKKETKALNESQTRKDNALNTQVRQPPKSEPKSVPKKS